MEEERTNGGDLPVVVDRRASTEMQRSEEEHQRALRAGEDRNSTGALVRLAMERNVDIAVLEKLLALKREEEAELARRAFVEAFAAFHAEAPTIVKDKAVGYEGRDKEGNQVWVGYTHATLGNVIETVGPLLGKHGFGWKWSPERTDKILRLTCRLTHKLGHFEESSREGPPDATGKKNPLQQNASTYSYLQRYTFLDVVGLATRDQLDDDGRSSGRTPAGPALSQKAEDTIDSFGKYLGGDNSQKDLERYLDMPATEWGGEQYLELRKLWPLVKKGDAETMAKIEAARIKGGDDDSRDH